MKRFFGLLIAAALALAPASAQSPQVRAVLLGVGGPAAAASLSIDGSAEANSSAATTAITLTTTKTNDIIVLVILTNAASISSVSGGGLTWARRATNGAGNPIETWWALAASALSSTVITVTPASAAFTTVIGFAVNGAKTSAPWDTNGVLPVLHSGAASDPASISTTAANTMIIGGFRMAGTGSPTAGAGYTGIALNADFTLAEYKLVSAAQSGLSVTIGTGVGDSNGSIADAIVQGP